MTFDRSIWDGAKPIVAEAFGARTIGPFALVTVGCEVWAILEARRDAHEEPLGGIVTEITDTRYSDGEIVRAFRCFDYLAPFHKAFRTIAEADIERDSIEAADPGRVVRSIRRMCAEVGKRRSSLLTGGDARLVADAHTLARVLMTGDY